MKDEPFLILRENQNALWALADGIVRGLREPFEGTNGDPRWTVSGLSNSVWEVSHPDLDTFGDFSEGSPFKIKAKRISPEKWGIFVQNEVEGFNKTKVVYTSGSSVRDWDLEAITPSISNFFREELDEVKKKKESYTSEMSPGTDPLESDPSDEGGFGGGMGGPVASGRIRRLAQRLTQSFIITLGNKRMANYPEYYSELRKVMDDVPLSEWASPPVDPEWDDWYGSNVEPTLENPPKEYLIVHTPSVAKPGKLRTLAELLYKGGFLVVGENSSKNNQLSVWKNPYTGQKANLSYNPKTQEASLKFHQAKTQRSKRRTPEQKARDSFVLYD